MAMLVTTWMSTMPDGLGGHNCQSTGWLQRASPAEWAPGPAGAALQGTLPAPACGGPPASTARAAMRPLLSRRHS